MLRKKKNEKEYIWVATRRPCGKTIVAANIDYDKCVDEAIKKGVKKPCLMLLPIYDENKNI